MRRGLATAPDSRMQPGWETVGLESSEQQLGCSAHLARILSSRAARAASSCCSERSSVLHAPSSANCSAGHSCRATSPAPAVTASPEPSLELGTGEKADQSRTRFLSCWEGGAKPGVVAPPSARPGSCASKLALSRATVPTADMLMRPGFQCDAHGPARAPSLRYALG